MSDIKNILTRDIDWSNKTILLVEDEEEHHVFISSALKKTKVNLLWAKDGREAIDMVMDNPKIDLILMDIRLPEVDGYEASRQIKYLKPKIPIVAQTAYVMSNEKGKVLQAGCDDLIKKPIRLKTLIDVCIKYLGN